jgi:tight adherence protein B
MKTAGLGEVASVTQRLAVLLGAGVAPASAWLHVAEGSSSSIPLRVVRESSDPAQIARCLLAAVEGVGALEAGGWRGLAAAWSVATDAGAPLAGSLRSFAASLRMLTQTQRDIQVALTAPVATARMMTFLPLVGILFGMGLGFNTAQTLFATPIGWGCLLVGAVLIGFGRRWNRRLIAAAQPNEAAPGIECELMAIAASGGASMERAREAVNQAIREFGLAARMERIDGVLELSHRAGVPAAELLRSEAEEIRRQAQAQAQSKAAALSVRLMLPLGVCILPAFMVLGVLPLIVTVISSTVGTF